ncbi:helical backbone metal receptor [Salisaeta longa]|uniref:helical backbone metal receptor n=1 Tax=Salisaeta longa TaxID=503170 RepID=UPI0003B478B6|nr:helical backbone metal receptor [Salisaeta longa]
MPDAPAPFPYHTTDALGRAVSLAQPPERIVSLVPSQTELLAALDVGERVVGITRFCERPEHWREEKILVGGTKQVDPEAVAACRPDLIIANKEENTPDDVSALAEEAPVYVTDVATVPAACAMMRAVGRLVDRAAAADRLAARVADGFAALDVQDTLRAAYFIWRDPWMTVGGDTFIHDVMQRAGLRNVFADTTRYPEVTLDAVRAAAPDVVLCSSEPFPFHQKPRFTEDMRDAVEAPVHVVDGQLFSWYGARLLHAPSYLQALRAALAAGNAPRLLLHDVPQSA